MIIDKITVIYNAKLAEDKKRDGTKKKANTKPKINTGKADDSAARNNNTAMVADLIGSDDDEYGAYGEEYPAGSKREAEGDYDFM